MTKNGSEQLREIADRLDDFNTRAQRIASGSPLSGNGTMAALALLTSIHLGTFIEAAAALRSQSTQEGAEQ